MVWKDNLLVNGSPITIDGFLAEYLPGCYFKDPKDIFLFNFYMDEKHVPRHFLFANFQCLRCGLCCKNFDCIPIAEEEVKRLELEGREDVLKNISLITYEIYSRSWTGCPLCRKVRGKPYYYCRIHSADLPVCKAYLCSKSIPVAHLKYDNIDELLEIIGMEEYYALIEREWGEEFDYSRCEVKTHKTPDSMKRD